MAGDRPLLGVGSGRASVSSPRRYVRNSPLAIDNPVVHNSYLQVLAETGMLGLAAFLAFLAGTWRLLGRARRRALAENDLEGLRLATAMQAAMVTALGSAIFLSAQLTTPFWLIGALATVVRRRGPAYGRRAGRAARAALRHRARMRVALVTSLERGGPLEHAIVLARGLVAAGAEVLAVCATAAAARRFTAAGARALVLPLRHQLDLVQAVRVRRALAGSDVVHAQDRRSGLWTRALPGPAGAVRVYTVHGLPDAYLPPPAGQARPSVAPGSPTRGSTRRSRVAPTR